MVLSFLLQKKIMILVCLLVVIIVLGGSLAGKFAWRGQRSKVFRLFSLGTVHWHHPSDIYPGIMLRNCTQSPTPGIAQRVLALGLRNEPGLIAITHLVVFAAAARAAQPTHWSFFSNSPGDVIFPLMSQCRWRDATRRDATRRDATRRDATRRDGKQS